MWEHCGVVRQPTDMDQAVFRFERVTVDRRDEGAVALWQKPTGRGPGATYLWIG
jgi:hypothetical protein